MKNPYEVLGQKEAEISRVRKEIEALQVAINLLAEDEEINSSEFEFARPFAMLRRKLESE